MSGASSGNDSAHDEAVVPVASITHVSPQAHPAMSRTWLDELPGGGALAREITAAIDRLGAVAGLLGRIGNALDDLTALREAAQHISSNMADLSRSAAGINQNSAQIAREITGLSHAAQGIDGHAGRLSAEIESVAKLVPTLQRLTEIVDPLDTTVVRLGRFVDRLPGGRRSAAHGSVGKPGRID